MTTDSWHRQSALNANQNESTKVLNPRRSYPQISHCFTHDAGTYNPSRLHNTVNRPCKQ